jgi:DNA-binding NarL/FixJ family response regulator
MTEIPGTKTIGIQILIADDSSLLRDRIKSVLGRMKNVFMVGESKNYEDISLCNSGLVKK